MARKLMMGIVMILLLAGIVAAVGVSPIRKVVDYEPGKVHDFHIKIRNDGDQDIKALIYAKGDLINYIGIKDALLTVTTADKEAIAKYQLTLPQDLTKPGVHKSELVVTEYPSDYGTGKDAYVSATASVVSEVWVRVPFPGKYAEGKLNIVSGGVGEQVQFGIDVMNFGIEDIKEASATIKILGATYEEIAVIQTDTVSIKSKETSKLLASWLADVNPGRYRAVVEIDYDNKKLVLEQNFDVGKLFIAIDRIDVRDFSLGDVAIFDIYLSSKWNEPISNVYGEMTILDEVGTQYDTIKTASLDLSAQGSGKLTAYWDTADIGVGTYQLRLLIHYASKVTERLIDAEVNIDSIQTSLGLTAEVVAGKGLGRDSLLTILVIILILINVGWFAYFIKSRKK